MGFFEKLKEGLKKTKEAVFKQVTSLFSRYTVIDDDLYEELEEILITSDVGVGTTEQILESLQEAVRRDKITEPEDARLALMKILAEMIGEGEPLNLSTSPAVVLVIGVNGVGKTTSIAKIANLLKKDGKKVILAAADTFRAAAIDQIAVWADRVGVELVRHDEGSDPASVVYDAISAAKSRHADVL
ncbi:MAG: signal recognition particle receptor subunit alpha, partial [Clostridia bacterium]|nr:signal recognition particle receptor subunit alpha [Clostridia bacterium]